MVSCLFQPNCVCCKQTGEDTTTIFLCIKTLSRGHLDDLESFKTHDAVKYRIFVFLFIYLVVLFLFVNYWYSFHELVSIIK